MKTSVWSLRLPAALALLACAWAAHAQDTGKTAAPPNIVFILSDDQGWGDVGYAGNPYIKTPELDALAAAGLRFDRFYSPSPSSSPARFAALTGVHPSRWVLEEGDATLPESFTTVAEALQQAGYRTGHFGKWNLGALDPDSEEPNFQKDDYIHMTYSPPDRHGFDEYFSTARSVPTFNPMAVPENAQDADRSAGTPYGTHYWRTGGKKVTANIEGPNPRVIMDRVEPFVRGAAQAGQPFFAAVWFHTPHSPVVAGPDHRAIYAKLPEAAQHYLGAITAMDEQIGRLARTLQTAGVAENTLLLFCSDNGPRGKREKPGRGTTAGLRGRKNTLYEGGIRVPALAVWPGVIEKERISESPVGLIDLMATFLDGAGIAAPEDQPRDGESFLPLLRGESWLRNAPLYFVFEHQRALVTPTHKLYSHNEGHRWSLYEITSDPSESRDLSTKQVPRMEQLQGLFEAWYAPIEARTKKPSVKLED